ncbi:hypothetical protein JW933_11395 [candidate division FCPU426 bacterium]|nr:hypothetical protein [candidate division FCPU426 bacterium]
MKIRLFGNTTAMTIAWCLLVGVPDIQAADIYTMNINGRSLGLGGSPVALQADYAASRNPAGMATGCFAANTACSVSLETSQARLAYDQYGYQVLALVPWKTDVPGAAGSLAFRFDQLITQNAWYYRLLYRPDGTPVIDPATNQQALAIIYDTRIDSLFGLGCALQILPGLSWGAEAQAVHMKVGEDFAWGYDGWMGLLYTARLPGRGAHKQTGENMPDTALGPVPALRADEADAGFSAGIVARHLNQRRRTWRVPYRTESGYAEIEAGMRWPVAAWQAVLFASISQRNKSGDLPAGRFGLEYKGFAPLALRLGWDQDHVNVGAGFVLAGPKRDQSFVIHVDYAAVTSGALYDANRITIRIMF